LPTDEEIAAALRVLSAVRNSETARRPDALIHRLWGGSGKVAWPLDKIADKIIEAHGKLNPHLPTHI
jgi:hypothetical protein